MKRQNGQRKHKITLEPPLNPLIHGARLPTCRPGLPHGPGLKPGLYLRRYSRRLPTA